MVGSWGAVPWLVRTRNISDESMATWVQAAGWPNGRIRFLLREKGDEATQDNTEEENTVRGSVAMVEILLPKFFSKLRKAEGLPQRQVG